METRDRAHTTDLSDGSEPRPIPIIDVSEGQINHLRVNFHYITDSAVPDGASIGSTPFPVDDTGEENKEEDVYSDDGVSVTSEEPDTDQGQGSWTCDCAPVNGACSVYASDTCDCVGSFGNFYSGEKEAQVLLLNALPDRLPLVECSPACSCSSSCLNRVSQKGVTVPISIRSAPAGLGAFYTPSTETNLPSGTFIALYAGEYLTTEQARARWSEGHPDNYTLSLRLPAGVFHIDPRKKGNVGRFLNHSCDPNCVIHVVRWGGGHTWPRAAIFSKKEIKPGEELTFDYGNASGSGLIGGESRAAREGDEGNDACVTDRRTRCMCNAPNCRGYMPFDETL
ncbi:hypothetical protein DB88DRAFT_478821 [Papiliotrema laurentii]|uniref:SET domain-containing protein n=1 Tax=Papiliotrema laurentii TaxID=5418 RepID=A0AAD9L9N5_PAPLA|nr:hypothetical protein DB88DRAFT_478821 [Papiliotrema laurentii]